MATLRHLLSRYRRKHDLRAFAKLFDLTAPHLMRLALHLTRDPARAEDLVQDTFLTLIQRSDQFDASRPVRPWLVGILRNHALNLNRRERRRQTAPLTQDPGEAPRLDDALDAITWSERAGEVIETLPEAYRSCLALRLYHGLAPAEIAAVLGKAPGTVRSLLHRGLTLLRDQLPARCGSPLVVAIPLLGEMVRMRSHVLTHARLAVPLGTSATVGFLSTFSGVVMMSKNVVCLAGLAASLLLLGGLLLSGELHDDAPTSASEAPVLRPLGGSDAVPSLAGAATKTSSEGHAHRASPHAAPIDFSTLDRTLDLHGRVLDADGSGIAGALLVVTRSPWRESGLFRRLASSPVQVGRTRSSTDGSFAVRLIPGSLCAVRVEAEGFATSSWVRLQPGERIHLIMQPAVVLEVTVLDDRGKPLAHAHVEVMSGYEAEPLRLREKADTNSAGVARFEGLPAKVSLRLVTRVRSAGVAHPPDVHVTLKSGEPQRVTVHCPRGISVRGRVVSKDSGRPIVGARVRDSTWLARAVTTDEHGAFEVYGLSSASSCVLTATAKGYIRGKIHAREDGTRVLAAAAQGHIRDKTHARKDGTLIEIRLASPARIVGTVVDLLGKPIAGARLNAIGSENGPLGQRLSTGMARTDIAGRFTLDTLNPDMPHTLVVAASGFGRRLFDLDRIAPESVLDVGPLALGPTHLLHGVVLDAAGEPVARVEVVLKGANPDRSATRRKGEGVSQSHYGSELERSTDDLGRFAFPDVSEGQFRVIVGRGPGSRSVDVTIGGNDSLEAIEIRMGGAREIVVRVLDDKDRPLEGVYVNACSASGRLLLTGATTDARGVARFKVPLARRVWIQLHFDNRPFAPAGHVQLEPDEAELTLHLKRAFTTSGLLVDEQGRPIRGAHLTAWQRDKQVGHTHGDNEGKFSFSLKSRAIVSIIFDGTFSELLGGSVQQGMLPLEARIDDVVSGTSGIRLIARTNPELRSLAVRVLTPDGKPMPHCYVSIGKGGVPTDAAGWARAHNLPDEALEVSVADVLSHRRPYLNPHPRMLKPAGQEVEIRMRSAHVIEGLALDTRGGRLARGRVLAMYSGKIVARSRVRDDGRFRIVFETILNYLDELRIEGVIDGVEFHGSLSNVAAGTKDARIELRAAGR